MSPLGIGLGTGLTERPHRHGGAAAGLPKLPLSARWTVEGDSITAGTNDAQYSWQAISATRGRLFNGPSWNQGTGGQTAAQMATQIAAVMATNPKLVTFLAGTNDLAGTSDTPAAIYANILACVKGYLDGGASYVVVSRVLPRNDATWLGLSAGRRGDLAILNGLIAGLPTDPTLLAAGYAGRVKLATEISATLNPATDCVDNLHPNWKGAIKLGNSFAEAINSILDQSALLTDLYSDASNLIGVANKNPQLTGTTGSKSTLASGSVTGEVANTWTVEENGGMTVVCSKTTVNGVAAQRIQVSGNNSTNGRIVNFRDAIALTGNIGDTFDGAIDFQLADGYQNLRTIACNHAAASTPNSNNATVMDGAGPLLGTLRSAVTTPLAAAISTTTFQSMLMFAAGPVAADITWARPFLRKVPAGQ